MEEGGSSKFGAAVNIAKVWPMKLTFFLNSLEAFNRKWNSGIALRSVSRWTLLQPRSNLVDRHMECCQLFHDDPVQTSSHEPNLSS
jgi:hypothetical protein